MRDTIKVINIKWSTVPNYDNIGLETFAFGILAKANLFITFTIRNTGMTFLQPAGMMTVTTFWGWTWRSHSFSCFAFKSVPTRTKRTVTFPAITFVRYLSVSTCKTCVVLALYGTVNRCQVSHDLERERGRERERENEWMTFIYPRNLHQ